MQDVSRGEGARGAAAEPPQRRRARALGPGRVGRTRSRSCSGATGPPRTAPRGWSCTTRRPPRTSRRRRSCRALRALDRFDRRRPLGPWLHRIVVNRAIDWSRARALRPETAADALPEPAAPAERAEIGDDVVAALADLGPEHRAVVVLRHLLGYTPGRDRDDARPPARDRRTRACAARSTRSSLALGGRAMTARAARARAARGRAARTPGAARERARRTVLAAHARPLAAARAPRGAARLGRARGAIARGARRHAARQRSGAGGRAARARHRRRADARTDAGQRARAAGARAAARQRAERRCTSVDARRQAPRLGALARTRPGRRAGLFVGATARAHARRDRPADGDRALARCARRRRRPPALGARRHCTSPTAPAARCGSSTATARTTSLAGRTTWPRSRPPGARATPRTVAWAAHGRHGHGRGRRHGEGAAGPIAAARVRRLAWSADGRTPADRRRAATARSTTTRPARATRLDLDGDLLAAAYAPPAAVSRSPSTARDEDRDPPARHRPLLRRRPPRRPRVLARRPLAAGGRR